MLCTWWLRSKFLRRIDGRLFVRGSEYFLLVPLHFSFLANCQNVNIHNYARAFPPWGYSWRAQRSGPTHSGCGVSLSSSSATYFNPIVRYYWDFDDRPPLDDGGPSPDVVSFNYGNAGAYTITLRVRDNDGLTDIATATIVVNPWWYGLLHMVMVASIACITIIWYKLRAMTKLPLTEIVNRSLQTLMVKQNLMLISSYARIYGK